MLSEDHVAEMYAFYAKGMSLCELGRMYKRERASIREVFLRRGLKIRPCKTVPKSGRLPNGQIAPAREFTAAEIAAMVAKLTRVMIPAELKHWWRKWPMKKRAEFLRQVRARLKSDEDRPNTKYSKNVTPFDYTTARAHAIAKAANGNLNSQMAAVKIKVCSQGVIWNDELWFWSHKAGYVSMGGWREDTGRRLLHITIWEAEHGRSLPAKCVIRMRDGNWNNLDPSNLALATRNDLARENQAKGMTRKSREQLDVLLRQTQQPATPWKEARHHDIALRLRRV